MTQRPSVPKPVQRELLTNSRRRCCLCFWLDGIDEVQKGQIAHLDGNPENNANDNLAFLCFDHHDAFDSTTRQSKNLEPGEIKHWRNELYKEIKYRFREETLLPELELKFNNLSRRKSGYNHRQAYFTLRNVGQISAKHVSVCFRLLDGTMAERPGAGWIVEKNMDMFESGGRVGLAELLETGDIILPDHTVDFYGLRIFDEKYPPGSELKLEYRIDAEGMPPIIDAINIQMTDDKGS